MLSSLARATTRVHQSKLLFRFSTTTRTLQDDVKTIRHFSSQATPADPNVFKAAPPAAITQDMAEGIQDTTLFYLRSGIAHQRLLALATDNTTPLEIKWPRMMEIYLSTQVFVISGLGFSGDEQGLQIYTQKLAQYMSQADEETKETYKKVGQETWRELLCTTFELDPNEIQPIQIVDARNIMHKVSSKMQEPKILMKIHKECSKVTEGPDIEKEIAEKHQVLQRIVLNDVYLGDSPSIPEEHGFGSGEKGYAKLQCVMADFEGDPLIQQYMAAATTRMWEAAGLDVGAMQAAGGGGNIRLPQAG